MLDSVRYKITCARMMFLVHGIQNSLLIKKEEYFEIYKTASIEKVMKIIKFKTSLLYSLFFWFTRKKEIKNWKFIKSAKINEILQTMANQIDNEQKLMILNNR